MQRQTSRMQIHAIHLVPAISSCHASLRGSCKSGVHCTLREPVESCGRAADASIACAFRAGGVATPSTHTSCNPGPRTHACANCLLTPTSLVSSCR